jgi:hypothetical protein
MLDHMKVEEAERDKLRQAFNPSAGEGASEQRHSPRPTAMARAPFGAGSASERVNKGRSRACRTFRSKRMRFLVGQEDFAKIKPSA